MADKRILNIVTSKPDSTDPTKKHWSQHGILIIGINDQGEERISLKLNSMPISTDFDGWFSAMPPKSNDPNQIPF